MVEKIKYKFLAGIICLLTGLNISGYAQDSSLKIYYPFSGTGTEVTDASGNSNNEILKNGAVIEQLGRFNVLNLGSQTQVLCLMRVQQLVKFVALLL